MIGIYIGYCDPVISAQILKIYSSQSALHFTSYHFGTEMAHVSRCAVKPY